MLANGFSRLILSALSFISIFAISVRAQADIGIGDFDGADYGGWTATGTAFGTKPATGTLANQQAVSGFEGAGLVNSYAGGDASIGTLESPVFTVQRDYLNFLVGGGAHNETRAELVVEGKVALTATGIETEKLFWVTWNLKPWAGKQARVRLVDNWTSGWGHILADQFAQSATAKAFQESHRPQYHFTADKGWLNDPNGLVYYAGEYHLFYQHNPYGIPWGNMTWGHAVSPDLIHWEHLPLAITPDNETCTAYSGSAAVDWENSAGFQNGSEKTMVIMWTSIGCGQRLAYSNDKGRTWTKWTGNPVIAQEGDARDPKLFWHAPSKKWIVAVWTPEKGGGIAFYGSTDLKKWSYLSIANGYFECPNIWQATVDGDAKKSKWLLHGADGQYRIGDFDGTKFTAESGPYPSDWGGNWYASQIFSDIPAADGRTVNITWMRGGDNAYAGMPFNQQMGIPTDLRLRTTASGVRLTRLPVKEVEKLRIHSDTWKDLLLAPGQNPLSAQNGDLYDVKAEFEAAGAGEFGFKLGGATIAYKVGAKTLGALDHSASLSPVNGRIIIRALLDRASLEVYGNDGEVALTSVFLPTGTGVEAYAVGGNVKIISMEAHKLRGSWDPKDLAKAWEDAKNPVAIGAPAHRTARTGLRAPAWLDSRVDALGRSFSRLGKFPLR